MNTLQQTFNGVWPLQMGGKYLRVIAADAEVTVRFFRNGSQSYEASAVGSGFYAIPEGGFDRIDLVSAVLQTVKIAISNGDGGYDVVSVVGGVTATLVLATAVVDTAPVSVGVAATALFAASTTRKSARFYNAGTVNVYLGGAGVTTANGALVLVPGATWIETDAPGAAWYGISGSAAQSVRLQGVTA